MFELTPFERRNHHIGRYNPFYELDRLERDFFGSSVEQFRCDIEDKGDAYEMSAELPGFEKKDIRVDIDGDYMTISAEHSSESEEKDKKGNYIRRERSYGSYSRSFDISGVRAEDIKGKYKDGVLKLHMPKKEGQAPSQKRLDIE